MVVQVVPNFNFKVEEYLVNSVARSNGITSERGKFNLGEISHNYALPFEAAFCEQRCAFNWYNE